MVSDAPFPPEQPNPCCFTLLEEKKKIRKQTGRKVYWDSQFKHSFAFACNIQDREGQRAPRTGSCPRSESLRSELPRGEEGRMANQHHCLQASPPRHLTAALVPLTASPRMEAVNSRASKERAATTFLPERSGGEVRAPCAPNPPKEALGTLQDLLPRLPN